MSEVHVRQLEQYLSNAIVPLIDVTDLAGMPDTNIQQASLSRALTAFSIIGLTGVSVDKVAPFVLDGGRDQGIDGCFYDEIKNTLVFVQSKWHNSGTKTIAKGDVLKFLHGIKLVLSANWDTFSPKFQTHKSLIEQVLLKPDVSVTVAVSFTGDNRLGDECDEVLKQFESEQNTVGDFLDVKVLDLRALHRLFRAATLASQSPFTAMLLDWGQTTEPHQAVYGRVCCEELAKLYRDVGETLFEPNIRSFLGDSEVNNQIVSTLLNRPDDFWYLNNGITGICTKYSKTAFGGGDTRQAGTFVFDGIQIVNGAQTIGAILKAYEKSPTKVAKAFAALKVISLEGTPLGFTDIVTLATNKQNRVEEKDFLSLDQNQTRVKLELASQQIQYVFRSGESVVDKKIGFDVTEGILALACSSRDVANAVLAKRNIGSLLDRKSSTYQSLFHTGISGNSLWSEVKKLRKIESALSRVQASTADSKKKQIFTHGNRVLSWAVFNAANVVDINDETSLDTFLSKAMEVTDGFVKGNYPEAYLAVFFKNSQKCTELANQIRAILFSK
ncbi:AIPR family protein [Ferribacterium limneticum]|uniref:AIPR family protein n=1 Tax=Ferribacterium limneticum TaxID=76259 RepID=UPI001CFBFA21|nr:AIPR family protein [Ferribacterium limneticum]UCV26925.1 AIPR family protein [Ferribacterium limneticum]UCV30842.1 AIPR family protein [Ferribacterium limneticum]